MKIRIIKENKRVNEAEGGFVTFYRGLKGSLLLSPESAFDLDEWTRLFRRALETSDSVAGKRLLDLRRASSGQYFTDMVSVATKYAGKNGTVYAVKVPAEFAAEASARAVLSSATMVGGGTSALIKPSELLQFAQKGTLTVVRGPGKVVTATSKVGVRAILRNSATRIAKGLAKGGIPALIGDIAGTVAAPYIISLLTGKDVEDVNRSTDIGWAYVLAAFPGGKTPQQAAYEVWSQQMRAKGQAVPSYEQYLRAKTGKS